jgi:tRNA threonylcarbamoyladenosine modification (KEOPS) complex Cgi121 subunit
MYTVWTQHLENEDQKKNFQAQIRSASAVLDKQTEIINSRLKAIESIQTGIEIYKQPGWEGLLAHYNGEMASLKWVRTLIDLDKQDKGIELP